MRPTAVFLMTALILAGCGRFGDSAGGLFGRITPDTLEPEGGYALSTEIRPGIPTLLSADLQPLNEGLLLVATGIGPTKGYHDAALVTVSPRPAGRMTPDADGVLRLRFVAIPPDPDTPTATLPARPESDAITTALALPTRVLSRVRAIEISGAANSITLQR